MNRRESMQLILGSLGLLIVSPQNLFADAKVSSEALEKWKALSPEQREKMRERFRKFKGLSFEQRQRLIQNSKRFAGMSPEQRQRILKNHERFEKLTRSNVKKSVNGFKNGRR
jgi:Zn-dependent oligopeptidase